jgi:ATP-dependent DNA helicase RecG
LPLEILKKYNLPTLSDMIKNLHYPEDKNSLKQAQRRLFFDKLLRIQISSKLVKDTYQNQAKLEKTQAVREIIKQFLSKLPFELTKAQKRAIKEIIDDTTSDKPMLRLLQ